MEHKRLIDSVEPHDKVTILTAHNQERTGRAVMRSSIDGWVLNMGGTHGTPGIATDENTIKVVKAKK